jgi:hypothetical protein
MEQSPSWEDNSLGLCSYGMLRNVEWCLVTDVSGQHNGPICCPESR